MTQFLVPKLSIIYDWTKCVCVCGGWGYWSEQASLCLVNTFLSHTVITWQWNLNTRSIPHIEDLWYHIPMIYTFLKFINTLIMYIISHFYSINHTNHKRQFTYPCTTDVVFMLPIRISHWSTITVKKISVEAFLIKPSYISFRNLHYLIVKAWLITNATLNHTEAGML